MADGQVHELFGGRDAEPTGLDVSSSGPILWNAARWSVGSSDPGVAPTPTSSAVREAGLHGSPSAGAAHEAAG